METHVVTRGSRSGYALRGRTVAICGYETGYRVSGWMLVVFSIRMQLRWASEDVSLTRQIEFLECDAYWLERRKVGLLRYVEEGFEDSGSDSFHTTIRPLLFRFLTTVY